MRKLYFEMINYYERNCCKYDEIMWVKSYLCIYLPGTYLILFCILWPSFTKTILNVRNDVIKKMQKCIFLKTKTIQNQNCLSPSRAPSFQIITASPCIVWIQIGYTICKVLVHSVKEFTQVPFSTLWLCSFTLRYTLKRNLKLELSFFSWRAPPRESFLKVQPAPHKQKR